MIASPKIYWSAAVFVAAGVGVVWLMIGIKARHTAPPRDVQTHRVNAARSGDETTGAQAAGTLPSEMDLLPALEVEEPDVLKMMKEFPETAGRIRGQIHALEAESLAESLERIVEREFFFWPGSEGAALAQQVPLAPDAGLEDLQRIVGNRRVLKLLEQLAALPSHDAARHVSERLRILLMMHQEIYEVSVMANRDLFPKGELFRSTTPSLPLGYPEADGVRLAVLGLVFIAGNLGLQDAYPAVRAVAEQAVAQREFFYDPEKAAPSVASVVMDQISLYNRLILGHALMETGIPDQTDRALVREELQLPETELLLTHYNAYLTTRDHPAYRHYQPDFSKGTIRVNVFPILSDQQFDGIYERAGHGR